MTDRREGPILFTAELVPEVIADRKTNTRRIAKFEALDGENLGFSGLTAGDYFTGKPQYGAVLRSRGGGGCWNDRTKPLISPYGYAGDRLWVQEAHRLIDRDAQSGSVIVEYAADKTRRHVYLTDAENEKLDARTSPLTRPMPGRFMYRSLSRTSLEVLSVRVERLKEISEADAKAEGVDPVFAPNEGGPRDRYRFAFSELWDRINGERASWASNPWVWVVSFRRIEQAKASVANG